MTQHVFFYDRASTTDPARRLRTNTANVEHAAREAQLEIALHPVARIKPWPGEPSVDDLFNTERLGRYDVALIHTSGDHYPQVLEAVEFMREMNGNKKPEIILLYAGSEPETAYKTVRVISGDGYLNGVDTEDIIRALQR